MNPGEAQLQGRHQRGHRRHLPFGIMVVGESSAAPATPTPAASPSSRSTRTCIAALSCDDFLKWYDNNDPKKPFPCQTEETAFRTDCPDFHLYNDNN
jgi:hypothetical protein